MSIQSEAISVSKYLDGVNKSLDIQKARILGEVCNLQLYSDRTYLYFSVKDKDDESLIKCFMWKRDYILSGVKLTDGLEIIVGGYPKIYKPNGTISLQSSTIELVGDGALRKAYEDLKLKLDAEGLFAQSRKTTIPIFPNRIGLITSKDGAVINDFLTNIGKYGYKISFVNSRVEGQVALKELLQAVRTLKKQDIDVLVILRGGGSLESFQAFNNEALVREIAAFPVPVLTGIGHDKDVPLISLVSDLDVSTPSIVASTLNKSWEQALARVNSHQRQIFTEYKNMIAKGYLKTEKYHLAIRENFGAIFNNFRNAISSLDRSALKISYRIKDLRAKLETYAEILNKRLPEAIDEKINLLSANWVKFENGFEAILHSYKNTLSESWSYVVPQLERAVTNSYKSLTNYEKDIRFNDPARQLTIGYSILFKDAKVIKTISDLKDGDTVNIRLSDGSIDSEIKKIMK